MICEYRLKYDHEYRNGLDAKRCRCLATAKESVQQYNALIQGTL
jgi:hypothetical protein